MKRGQASYRRKAHCPFSLGDPAPVGDPGVFSFAFALAAFLLAAERGGPNLSFRKDHKSVFITTCGNEDESNLLEEFECSLAYT